MPWDARAIVFLKAADLLAGKYRQTINAATMLNMSKTPHQAEINAACELIDFWRFNPHFMRLGYEDQPNSTHGLLNYMEHRQTLMGPGIEITILWMRNSLPFSNYQVPRSDRTALAG